MDDTRLMFTDAAWERLAAAPAEIESRAGAPPKPSDRDVIEAVLYLARTGYPRRDLPARFGKRDAVSQRFRRRGRRGYWGALFARLPEDLQAVHTILFDSAVVRAPPHAAGAVASLGTAPASLPPRHC